MGDFDRNAERGRSGRGRFDRNRPGRFGGRGRDEGRGRDRGRERSYGCEGTEVHEAGGDK